MIDITTALYNIMHSRYGRDVRTSIHDAIYQIDANANEALQNAKTMGVGTDISSPTSSSTGYVAGNLYLNNSTWDLWQCIGTDSWVNNGNIKGATGARGADGTNYYIFIRYSANYDGTGFTATPTASSQYMGVYYGTSATAPTNKMDYQWTSYVGAAGTSAYVHIMYSDQPDGTGFVSVPTAITKYIGFYAGTLASPPANKSYYTWSEYVGRSGSGTGDMTAAEYAPSGTYGKVDHAILADSATNATNSENLKESDGTIVSADDITAKIAKLDSIADGDTSDGVVTQKIANLDSNGKLDADNVIYDNTTSGLTATDTQSAIDELTNELSSLGVIDIDIIQNAQVYTISANTSKNIIEENAPTDHAFYIYNIKFQTNTNSGITVDGNANVTSYSGSVGGVNTVYKWHNGTKFVSDGFTLYAKKGQGVSAGLWSTTTGQAAVTVQRIGIL